MIKKNFHMDYSEATNYSVAVPTTLMVAVPLISYFVDRKFNKSVYLMLSSIIGILSFLSLYYIEGKKIFAIPCLILVGIYYSLFGSSIWSAGAQACPEKMIDIGLAIMDTVQSIATFIFPIIFDKLNVDSPGKLLPILVIFNLVGFLLSIWLYCSLAQYILIPDIQPNSKKVKESTKRIKATEPRLYQKKKREVFVTKL